MHKNSHTQTEPILFILELGLAKGEFLMLFALAKNQVNFYSKNQATIIANLKDILSKVLKRKMGENLKTRNPLILIKDLSILTKVS